MIGYIGFRIAKKHHKRLRELARASGTTVSTIIKKALLNYYNLEFPVEKKK